MAPNRRSAEIKGVLVYFDEPQLLALKAGKSIVVAVAIPSSDAAESNFLATTVSQRDWDSYKEQTVDLRYLFTYSDQRLRYTFDLRKATEGKVMMTPFRSDVPDHLLPQPRFFAVNHTAEFDENEVAADTERLYVDGAWDMPEFGRFYQRYSDIYSFLVAMLNWKDAATPPSVKAGVSSAFSSKPFQGGSSYRHFYQDLVGNLQRNERLGLQQITYASPGHVDVHGREDAFEDVQGVIRWFMDNRPLIDKHHKILKSYLSKLGLLQIPGDRFQSDDARSDYIVLTARALNTSMRGPDFDTVFELAKNNALVAAKIVLSFYRRVDEAAQFFSQGRVNFDVG